MCGNTICSCFTFSIIKGDKPKIGTDLMNKLELFPLVQYPYSQLPALFIRCIHCQRTSVNLFLAFQRTI